MSVFRKKFISVLFALSMIGTVSNLTVYADELDGTVTDDDYIVDDGNTGDYIPPDDTPAVDDVPADDTNDYPNSDNTTDTPTPDYTPDDSYSDTGNQDDFVDDNIDYSADSGYSTGYDNSYTDNSYVDYYEPQYDYSYDDGMSFEEFERATDYSSATVNAESPTIDMYNSNGSDTNTLSNEDWNDIKLNLGETSADGTGDFSFIKNNTSDENSNKSILFLIFGIVFVLSSVSLIAYLVLSAIRSRKLKKSGVYSNYYSNYTDNSRRNHIFKNIDSHATRRTKFNYDTDEIDITNYNDNF